MHSRNHLHLPWSVKHKKNVWTVLISPWWTLLPRSAANIEISMWMLVFMCVVNMWINLILYENLVWKVWVCYFLFCEILKENMIWFQLWTHIYSRTRGKIKTVQCKSDIVISRPKRLRGSSQEIPAEAMPCEVKHITLIHDPVWSFVKVCLDTCNKWCTDCLMRIPS